VGFIAKLLHRIYERLIKRQWQFSKIGSPAGSGFKEGSDGGPDARHEPRQALAERRLTIRKPVTFHRWRAGIGFLQV